MRAPVISGCDTSPILDPAEDVFDLVALSIELLVVMVLDLAVLAWRDARCDAALDQDSPEPVAVISFVGQEFFGLRKCRKQQKSAFMVAHLSLREQHHDRRAQTIRDSMKLRVQTPFGAPDTSGKSPPFKRLAAVRCAFRCVASIMVRSGSPALPAPLF